jgi:hypothetical protein
MTTLTQEPWAMWHSLVTFGRAAARFFSGPDLHCRDCAYHATCSLPPGPDCIPRANWMANRNNRPPQYRALIDWWAGFA